MSKKTLLFFIIILIAAPFLKADAAQYFVGVTMASGSAPGYTSVSGATTPTDNYWCMRVGTTLSIRNNSGSNLPVCTTSVTTNCYVAPTLNPTTFYTPTCAGDTVWSPLVSLVSGTPYQIYFDLPDGDRNYCPGFDYGYCWVSWEPNKNCCETCAHYGMEALGAGSGCTAGGSNCYSGTVYQSRLATYPNCALEAYLMGGECSSCTTGAAYSYYNSSTYACWTKTVLTYETSSNYTSTCAAAGAGLTRVCACSYTGSPCCGVDYYPTFTFTFTPTF